MADRYAQALALLKEGDRKGLKEIFDLLYTPLCLFSEKFVGKREVAEDIVQEVFISFWEKKSYESIKSNLSSYLYRSVRNKSINYLRALKIKTCDWMDDYLEIYEEIDDTQEYKEEILKKTHQAIEELPKGCRNVFTSVTFNKLSYKQAAEYHNISINTVRSQLQRATKKLHEKLDGLSFLILMHILFSFLSK